MVERPPVRERTEFQERKIEVVRTEQMLLIVQRLALRPGAMREVAMLAMQQLAAATPDSAVTLDFSATEHAQEVVQALRYEIEFERLQYGDESVPERQQFLEQRGPVQERTRRLRAALYHEYFTVTTEALLEQERGESALYQECNTVLQDVTAAMGFQRPVILELTRARQLNAFVLRPEKLGDSFDEPSTEPIHVFVNVGLITELSQLFKSQNKVFTKDHLAAILGHELRHLQQKQYQPDEGASATAAEARVRYEYDADLGGMEGADLAGFNPMGAIEVQQAMLLAGSSWAEVIRHYFHQTHPVTQNRVTTLLEEYHRPERVFYNADQPLQPFSDAALANANELAREELIQDLKWARSVNSWNELLDKLDAAKTATIRDDLMVLDTLRLHLDVQTALSTVEHALETDRWGLRSAILYEANLKVTGQEINCSLIAEREWRDSVYSYYEFTDESKDHRGNILRTDVGLFRAPENQLVDLDSVRDDEMLKAIEFHTQHVVMVPPQETPTGPFVTISDLFDPNNPAACSYWGIPEGWMEESKRQEQMDQHRYKFMERLSNRILRGFKWKYTLRGTEQIALKQEVLNVFEAARAVQADGATTTEAFPKSLAELGAMVEARISQSKPAGDVGSLPKAGKSEYVPELNYNERYAPYRHTAVMIGTPLADTGWGRVYQRVMNRLQDHWTKATTPAEVQRVTGEVMPPLPDDISEALFCRTTVDTVYPHLSQPIIPESLAALQRWGTQVPLVLRRLPLLGEQLRDQRLPFAKFDRLDYQSRFDARTRDVKELMTGAIGQAIHTAPLAEIGDVMKQVQQLHNHPYFEDLFRHGPDRYQPDSAIAALAPHAFKEPPFYKAAVRPHLFARWIREGLTANLKESNASAWLQELTTILVSQAEMLGLPADYFVGALEGLPKRETPPLMLRIILNVLEVVAKQKMTQQRAEMQRLDDRRRDYVIIELAEQLDRMATELYAAGMAEDINELKGLATIHLGLYDTGN